MSKQVEAGAVTDHTVTVTVGETALVTTDDEMEYHFFKPTWFDKWYFSHRVTVEDGERKVNADNRMLPQSVVAWANQNLGYWDFYNGQFQITTETGNFSEVIREKRSA